MKYSKIKVLLADDRPLVLEGIKSCLSTQSHFEVVGEASDGSEAIRQARDSRPDVLVTSLTEIYSLDARGHLRQVSPQLRVLILNSRYKNNSLGEIIRSGAHGWIQWSSSPAELIRAIERVHRGERFFEGEQAGASLKGTDSTATQPATLSLREREVLVSIAHGAATKEIADQLGLSVRTVEKHRQRVMNKLGIHKATELVRFAIARRFILL